MKTDIKKEKSKLAKFFSGTKSFVANILSYGLMIMLGLLFYRLLQVTLFKSIILTIVFVILLMIVLIPMMLAMLHRSRAC